MAMAAEITYGTPINLDLDSAYADLGVETRGGKQVISLALDDGAGFVHLVLSPERAQLLGDALHGLARIG